MKSSRRVTTFCALGAGGIATLVLLSWVCGLWQFGTFGPDDIPMAPSTACLIILLSGTVWLRNRWPASRGAIAFGVLAVLLAGIFSVMVLAEPPTGLWMSLDRWLSGTDATVKGIPVGRMSAVTALAFLGVVLALMAEMPPFCRQRWFRSLAVMLALGVIVTGFVITMGYGAGTPILYGSGFVPMALLTAIAFVLLGLAILFAAGWDSWPLRMFGDGSSKLPQPSHRFAWAMLGILALTVTAIGVGGFFYLKWLDSVARWDREEDVSTVADLKISQIVNWRKERLGDANVLFNTPSFASRVREYLTDPSRDEARREIDGLLALFHKSYDYERMALLDPELKVRLSVPRSAGDIGAPARQLAQEAMRSRQVMFSDLHRADGHGNIHMDLIVPIFLRDLTAQATDGTITLPALAGQPPLGVVILQINPHKFLYPLIQTWPTPSASSETLLVRRDGDDVLFLNELRHRKVTALAMRLPLSRSDLPAAKAVRGEVGVCEGVDYRGVPVLAALRAVPDSPWFMVAKVDEEEVYAPLRQQTWTVVVIMAVLAVASCLGVALLWWRHERHLIRQQLQSEQEQRALAERVEHLMQNANDIIVVTDKDWRIVEANQRAVDNYGYPMNELRRMSLADLRAGTSRWKFLQHTQQLLATGRTMYETAHRRKDGSVFPVEISARMVEIGGMRHGLAIIRDITLRKTHEQEIERLNRLYATLSQINQSIVHVKSREELFREVCRVTAEFGGFKVVWIGRRDPKTQQVIPVARAGEDEGYLDKIKVYEDDRPEGHGPVGTCIREGRPCIFNDFLNAAETLPWHQTALAHGLRAVAAMPIHFKDKVWGAFTVYDGEADAFQDKEVALLEEAAMDISYAMESLDVEAQRQQAEEAVAASNKRLQGVLDNIAQGYYALDRDWRVVAVNAAAEEHFGKSAAELIGGTFEEATQGRIPDNVREGIRQVMADGQPQHFEVKSKVRPGTWAIDYIYPRDGGVEVYFTDITERKWAELALRQAEQKYRAIFENAVEGIYQSTPDGRILSANPAMAAMHGYASPEEFIADIRDAGRQLYVDPARREEFKRLLEERGEARHFESQVRRKDGRIIWISGNARAVRDAGGKVIHYEGAVQDITEHKRTEEEREITVRLLGLFNASNSLHQLMREVTSLLQEWFECDAVGVRLQDGDDYPYFETRGFPAEFVKLENQLCLRDASGQPVRDPDGHPILECMCGNVLCGRFDPAKPFFTAHGSFWTNCTTELLANTSEADRQARTRNRCNGEGYKSVALVALRVGETTYGLLQANDKRRDRFSPERIALLERLADSLAVAIAHRQSQRSLKESEERYRKLIDLAPDAIFININDRVVLPNPAALRLFGATRAEQMASRPILDFFHPDYHAAIRERIGKLRNQREPVPPLEGRIIRLDGSEVDVEVSATPFAVSETTGILVILRDISERKRMERERAEIEGQLRQQQKLESIGTLASGIAHEINNPITGIMNYAQLIADAAAPDSLGLKYGREIIHETERVATIVKNLLQFARQEKQSHSPARMQDIVEQTLSLIHAVMGRDQITIQADMLPDLPAFKCRSQQIQQVFMNLLTNARDALNEKYAGYDERKVIQVTGRMFEKEGRRWVRLTVEDHGNGIPEAIQPRIFDPFFTTKPRDKGTGLGLSISHGIATEHHGELHFETEAGRFTRFHLDLPVDNGWGLENSKTSEARASKDPRRTS